MMPVLGGPVPILRMFDEALAREFYFDFLGFSESFAHRFGPNFPLYLGIRRDGCDLHLSGHFGDATPGGHVRIGCAGLGDWALALTARDYRHARPGAFAATPWGTREMTITDPSGNNLTFYEAAGQAGTKA